MTDQKNDPQSVGDVLDRLKQLGEEAGDEKAKLGDAIQAMGHRAYGPFFILFPLIDISPVGGIPGLPTAMALVMALLALQLLFGREDLWLPGFLANRGLKGKKLVTVANKMRPVAKWLDRWFHDRMPAFTKGPIIKVAAVAIIALCTTVPPLELLPFASTLPMVAILSFGLALLVRDGLLMLIACGLSVAAIGGGLGWFFNRSGQGG
ncbi:exopolysaccharide biosynthesis protein [Sphingomonas sp. PL-96]|uniref:exopolysaccharide biosynthesis protein n=1 Tax=Sphingomonas sp. PL-96 TaxID=2887201 RepID=UPI001E2CB689|nr:exopolysaccharide biosynthesis protein [Sphingomonas sp. PL-96]MCC2976343.1 exopolysaccharide biosynthesis protein [Sphingomonas sp. PL-96]